MSDDKPSGHASTPVDISKTAADLALTEDSALALLKNPDLSSEIIEQFAKSSTALKSRKVKIALVSHPHTPRHISVPLARYFYTFDLMRLALASTVPADLKIALDDVLIARLDTVTFGERVTLARRASGRVAAALLLEEPDDGRTTRKTDDHSTSNATKAETGDRDGRVMRTALDNPRLTEALVISSVLRPRAGAALVHAVSQHSKWSPRREVQWALLRTEYLSLARALEFSREVPPELLPEVLASSRLPIKIKEQILNQNR